MIKYTFLVCLSALYLGFAACTPVTAQEAPTSSPQRMTVAATPTGSTPTLITTVPTLNSATAVPDLNPTPIPTLAMNPSPSTQGTPTVQTELVLTLERARDELRAAENAVTPDQARIHAQTAVNLLVGKLGRWYGGGVATTPSGGKGVLPGEIRTQGADLDNASPVGNGLALQAVGTQSNTPGLTILLGDVALWRTKPGAGYDGIAAAIRNATTSPTLDTLKGTVPRAVAFARLVMDAANVEQAHAFAASGVQELEIATGAAHALVP